MDCVLVLYSSYSDCSGGGMGRVWKRLPLQPGSKILGHQRPGHMHGCGSTFLDNEPGLYRAELGDLGTSDASFGIPEVTTETKVGFDGLFWTGGLV